MKKILLLICLLNVLFVFGQDEPNVVIQEQLINYKLSANKGVLSSVKIEENNTFKALRSDDVAVALTFYGDGISIDKAQAPGVKPIYRSWEDDDIFYTGSRVCALPLSLKKEKPVKTVFERTIKEPEHFCQIILSSSYRILQGECSISVPVVLAEKITLKTKNFTDNMSFERETKNNGDVIYTVHYNDLKPLKSEPMAASIVEVAPQILISGYFENIDSLYKFLSEKIEDENSEKVDSFAQELCKDLPDDMSKIDAIACWVRNNIRYVAIENGEFGLRPVEAEKVFINRYGDCKGSANLIRMMLRAIGIDGRMVWIGTKGHVPGTWTELVSLAAGNHQIAAAVLPDTTIFIDGTVPFAPNGYIPPNISGQQCLIFNGEKCLVDTVPEIEGVNLISLNGVFTLTDNILEGDLKATYEGAERILVESLITSVSAPKRKSLLQKLLSFGRKSVLPDNIEVISGQPDSRQTEIKYQEKDSKAVKNLSSGKIYVQFKPFRTFEYDELETKNRNRPLKLSRKKNFETVFTFTLPDGLKISQLPEDTDIKTPWFTGYIHYIFDEGTSSLKCEGSLKCIRNDGDISEIPQWNEMIKTVADISNAPVVLERSIK